MLFFFFLMRILDWAFSVPLFCRQGPKPPGCGPFFRSMGGINMDRRLKLTQISQKKQVLVDAVVKDASTLSLRLPGSLQEQKLSISFLRQSQEGRSL